MFQAQAMATRQQHGGDSSHSLELCLLSLDGGGIRGLSSLLILKQIMESLDPLDPPKPCDYFDMICGTSTGGLIAIMLGRMRLTVDECIDAYMELSSAVFTKVHHRIRLNGHLRGRFDHEALENGVQDLLIKYKFKPDELLMSPPQTEACKTFVCATSKQTAHTVVLSSYHNARRGTDILKKARIWEVARATSAATSFFDSITFADEGFVDGATGANNPISQLWTEANDIWGGSLEGSTLEDNIKCLVSIGTGIPSLTPFGDDPLQIGKTLVAIATDTEEAADQFHKHHSKLYQTSRAFRFNVIRGLQGIGLEDVSKRAEIKAATRAYIQSEEVFLQVSRCAKNLAERDWLEQLLPMIIQHAGDGIVSVNARERPRDIQWMAHTNRFHSWLTGGGLSVLWYKIIGTNLTRDQTNIAKSVANLICQTYPSFVDFGFRNQVLSRSLYFYCLRRTDIDVSDTLDTDNELIRTILRSLICQSLLMDCSRQAQLERKILGLGYDDRDLLVAVLRDGDKTAPLNLFGVLRRVMRRGPAPDLIAVEAVDALGSMNLDLLITNLIADDSRRDKPIKLLFTGGSALALTAALKDAIAIDIHTEYEECLQSLYFKEWNARSNQVADAETGTNKWVWEHPAYKSWKSEASSILWIEGKPGSGKSVLAKSVQRVFQKSAQRQGTGISNSSGQGSRSGGYSPMEMTSHALLSGFFFSSRMGERGISHIYLLRSLLYQLLKQDELVLEHFLPVYRQQSLPIDFESHDNWLEAGALEVFGKIAAAGIAVLSIIDAMDESKGIKSEKRGARNVTIMSTLSKLVTSFPDSRLKFIVLSRPDAFIELDFKKTQQKFSHTHRITLEWNNGVDIKLIIDSGLGFLRGAMHTFDSDDDESDVFSSSNTRGLAKRKRGLAKKVKDTTDDEESQLKMIRNYLIENANGVILWVTLIISDLEMYTSKGMFTFSELEQRLLTLPVELDELYAHILKGMQDSLNQEEFSKARNTFMLISGSGILGRPMSLRELWDALAIPNDAPAALKSSIDPIVKNRIPISKWTSFRRQLRQKCGPLIEVLRTPVGDDLDETHEDIENIGPEQTVQLIHRTVKDFLETPERAGSLHFSADTAVDYVKLLVDRFSQIAFPRVKTSYAPLMPVFAGTKWTQNVEEISLYLNERIFLSFALAVSPGRENEVLGPYDKLFENSVQPCARYWGEEKIRDTFQSESKLYPWSSRGSYDHLTMLTVITGYYFQYSCQQALVTAAKNLVTIANLRGQINGERLQETIKNGVLLAAINNNLLAQVKLLTHRNRHHGLFFKPEWRGANLDTDSPLLDPFLRLAVEAGNSDICIMMFDRTAKFCTQQNRLYVRAVSVVDLHSLEQQQDPQAELRDKMLKRCEGYHLKRISHADSEDLDDIDTEEVVEAMEYLLDQQKLSDHPGRPIFPPFSHYEPEETDSERSRSYRVGDPGEISSSFSDNELDEGSDSSIAHGSIVWKFLDKEEQEHGPDENDGDSSMSVEKSRDSLFTSTAGSKRIDDYKHVSTRFNEAARTAEYIVETESQRDSIAESSVKGQGKAKAVLKRFFAKSRNKEA